jgi:phosphatidylglycerophosphate synthase
VRILARHEVKPNTVTAWSYVLAIAVIWLFAEGWFGTGLLLGWLMTFLDTVDGKLARCTLTSSHFGNIFDHGLDQVHPPIWWGAFAIGLPGGLEANAAAAWVVVGGYLAGRAIEGVFLAAFRMEFFLWQPFDGFFRTIIARRNPNLILLSLGVLAASPTAGYSAVAVWTVLCIVIAATRTVQAFAARSRGMEIVPCLQTPTIKS